MPAATASPWGPLLGQPVPDVRTASAHLVVAGRRVATPKEVLMALGLPVRGTIVDIDDDGDISQGDEQLARSYCVRLAEIGGHVDQADLLPAELAPDRKRGGRPRKDLASGQAQLTRAQREERTRAKNREYYHANKDRLSDYHRQRYARLKAEARQEQQPCA